MALNKRCIPTVVVTGLLVPLATNLSAEENPFQAEVFHSVSFQVADLDEEGCGGAMTEYRRQPAESEAEDTSKPESTQAEQVVDEEKGVSFWQKIKQFWAKLFS
jgi:hypothetical protein